MQTDIQSILAIVIVVITAGVILYFKFVKKQDGCAGGCGCSKESKNSPSADPKKK